MTKKYRVLIEETISEEFEIEATSKENAISETIKLYKIGELVLCPENIEHRQLSVIDDSECSKWVEF